MDSLKLLNTLAGILNHFIYTENIITTTICTKRQNEETASIDCYPNSNNKQIKK